MARIELAELMQQDNNMTNWAYKVKKNIMLSEDEKEINEVVDAWAKEIGEGKRSAYELSEYIVRILEPEVYTTPDEVLDALFERGTIGEFEDVQANVMARNTLVARKSVRNMGNVDKSYIDYALLKPIWEHLQINTEVSMEKLRKGGYKTIADLTTFAVESFKNAMFNSIFTTLDGLITSPSAQGFVSASSITKEAMDSASDYLLDRGTNNMFVGLSTLIRPINRLDGYKSYLSEDMKNNLNRYGTIELYNGIKLNPISPAEKLGDGSGLFPQGKIIGIADKIGKIDMRGEMRVLQTPDNNREVIDLKITGFEFGYLIDKLDKVCKIVVS